MISLRSPSSSILALCLLLFGTFFRVIRADLAPETLPNFSPLMAAALCGALYLPGWIGLIVPLSALLVSDAMLNLHLGEPLLSSQLLWTLPCYLMAVGLGWNLHGKVHGLLPVVGSTLAASVFFYLVTNTGSWLGLARYPQTFSGWAQAMTSGLPGFPPTLTFFRNSLLGDLLFAACFVLLERSVPRQRMAVRVVA
jgi:hypothetical protein